MASKNGSRVELQTQGRISGPAKVFAMQVKDAEGDEHLAIVTVTIADMSPIESNEYGKLLGMIGGPARSREGKGYLAGSVFAHGKKRFRVTSKVEDISALPERAKKQAADTSVEFSF